ncbi:hypothetical protein ACJX0J_016725, partial [Zea mays]
KTCIWVPKAIVTNLVGPNKSWVPKTQASTTGPSNSSPSDNSKESPRKCYLAEPRDKIVCLFSRGDLFESLGGLLGVAVFDPVLLDHLPCGHKDRVSFNPFPLSNGHLDRTISLSITLAKYKRPLLIHAERIHEAEDHDLQDDELDPRSYMTYLKSRPPSCGASLSIETCPHYLTFSSEEVPDGDTRFKCSPPICGDTNRENLWKALLDGHIDMLSSDHSPSTPDLKLMEEGDFLRAWGGISSLQWSERPPKLAGQKNKGAILPGYHADIVVWNPKQNFNLTITMLYIINIRFTSSNGPTTFELFKMLYSDIWQIA